VRAFPGPQPPHSAQSKQHQDQQAAFCNTEFFFIYCASRTSSLSSSLSNRVCVMFACIPDALFLSLFSHFGFRRKRVTSFFFSRSLLCYPFTRFRRRGLLAVAVLPFLSTLTHGRARGDGQGSLLSGGTPQRRGTDALTHLPFFCMCVMYRALPCLGDPMFRSVSFSKREADKT
jgi:hypothetical protein